MEATFPPLEVFAMDEGFNRLTGSIPYKSLTWNRKYHEVGDFMLEVPADIYSPDWAYIYCDARPETGIVQKVEYTDDARDSEIAQGSDTITVSGFFLEAILNRVTFLVEETEMETYYVDPPSRPYSTAALWPSIYHDANDNLYYETREGTICDASGNQVAADIVQAVKDYGLEERDFLSCYTIEDDLNAKKTFLYFYSEDDGATVTRQQRKGDFGTYDVAMKDDKGNMFYFDDYGELCQAAGVASKSEDTYWRRYQQWKREGGYERQREVMGPWSTLDLENFGKERDNVLQCLDYARLMMGELMFYDTPEFEGEAKVLDPSLQRLGDFIYSELETVGASVRVEYDFEDNIMALHIWRGLDRTQAQSVNPWAVFNDTWGTLYGYSASHDISNYRNKCYVLYEYDEPTSWLSDGRPDIAGTDSSMSEYHIPYTAKRGKLIARLDDGDDVEREIYLDLRDEKPSFDDWPRDAAASIDTTPYKGLKDKYAAYPDTLIQKGIDLLKSDYTTVTNLETGTLDMTGYLDNWDLGDKVDMAVDTLGLTAETRIIAVSENYSAGQADISIEIGDKLLTREERAALI